MGLEMKHNAYKEWKEGIQEWKERETIFEQILCCGISICIFVQLKSSCTKSREGVLQKCWLCEAEAIGTV